MLGHAPIRKTLLLILLVVLISAAVRPVLAQMDRALGQRFPEFYALQLLWRAAKH